MLGLKVKYEIRMPKKPRLDTAWIINAPARPAKNSAIHKRRALSQKRTNTAMPLWKIKANQGADDSVNAIEANSAPTLSPVQSERVR